MVPHSLRLPWNGIPNKLAPPAAGGRRTGAAGCTAAGVGSVDHCLGGGSLALVRRGKTMRTGCRVRMCSGPRIFHRLRGPGKPRSEVAPATGNRICSLELHSPVVPAHTGIDREGWPVPTRCKQAHTLSRGRTLDPLSTEPWPVDRTGALPARRPLGSCVPGDSAWWSDYRRCRCKAEWR